MKVHVWALRKTKNIGVILTKETKSDTETKS